MPDKITIDGRAAKEAALTSDHDEHCTAIERRQLTELHNMVAQDPSAGTRVTRPLLGVTSFDAARSPRIGVEQQQKLRQGQLASGVDQDLTVAEPC